jgi:hypothetical protein
MVGVPVDAVDDAEGRVLQLVAQAALDQASRTGSAGWSP